MRGIAVFDMEIDGDYSVVGEVEKALKDWAITFIKERAQLCVDRDGNTYK